jgi:hypothetical protein
MKQPENLPRRNKLKRLGHQTTSRPAGDHCVRPNYLTVGQIYLRNDTKSVWLAWASWAAAAFDILP